MNTPAKDFNKTCIATRLMFLIAGICISCWAPMIPFAKSNLDLDEAGLGLVLLSFGVGALLTMPLTGWLVHRFGSRNIIITATTFLLIFLPLLTLAPSTTLLSLLLFLFGASSGAMNVSVNSQAVLVESRSPRPLMSGFHCLFSFGGLIGAGLLSILLELGYGLHESVVVFSTIMFLVLLVQFRRLLPKSEENKKTHSSGFSVPSGKVIFIALLCFIGFLSEGAVLDWSAVFLRSSHDYSESSAGIGYAAFSIAMSLGRFFGDRIIQKIGRQLMIQLGGFTAAAGYILTVTAHWGHLELLGFILIGFGASNIVPILFSTAGNLPNTSPSLALTMVTTLGYAGILLGPAILGFVAQATTLSIALSGVALLLMLVGFSSRVVGQQESQVSQVIQ